MRTNSVKRDTTYNGWPNYQTWNVMLWMDNEEHAYRCYRRVVEDFKQRKRRFNGADAKSVCADAFGEGTPDGVSFDSSKVRWGRIAEAMRED